MAGMRLRLLAPNFAAGTPDLDVHSIYGRVGRWLAVCLVVRRKRRIIIIISMLDAVVSMARPQHATVLCADCVYVRGMSSTGMVPLTLFVYRLDSTLPVSVQILPREIMVYRNGHTQDLVSLRPGEVVRVISVRKHRFPAMSRGSFIYADQAT